MEAEEGEECYIFDRSNQIQLKKKMLNENF